MTSNSGKETSSEIVQKYKEIIKSNGISDEVSEVIIEDPGIREGFASLTRYVTVKFSNPDLKPLNLFTKLQTTNATNEAMQAEMRTFPKEASFLREYLPAARLFCESKGHPDLIDFYPKCYYGDNEMIVLENLVLEKGYIMLDKVDKQDLDAASLAVQTLAKHHAISHALIQEAGGAEKFFDKYPDFLFDTWTAKSLRAVRAPIFQNGVNISINILRRSGMEKFRKVIEKLDSMKGTVYEDILSKIGAEERAINVLNHGDFWNNNMMFLRDQKSGKLCHLVAIDLQMVRYNSPVIDLLYYMFTSVKPNVRKDNLKDLLVLYLDTFQRVTKDLGHPVKLDFKDLFEEFRKKLEPFGLGFGLLMTEEFAAVMNMVDLDKVDMKDWPRVFDELTQKHLKSCSPERIKEIEAYILALIEEVEALTL